MLFFVIEAEPDQLNFERTTNLIPHNVPNLPLICYQVFNFFYLVKMFVGIYTTP